MVLVKLNAVYGFQPCRAAKTQLVNVRQNLYIYISIFIVLFINKDTFIIIYIYNIYIIIHISLLFMLFYYLYFVIYV